MNKIAVLVLCHKNFDQVSFFINQFDESYYDIYLHIDLKSNYDNKFDCFLKKKKNVFILNPDESYDVKWGHFSIIKAELSLLKVAKQANDYSYFWLCSGQDLLLKDSIEIYNTLFKKDSVNYLNVIDTTPEFQKRVDLFYPSIFTKNTFLSKIMRNIYKIITGGRKYTFSFLKRKRSVSYPFYFGSQWFCLEKKAVIYILEKIQNSNILDDFKYTLVPDESFFQTILMNSKFKETIQPHLLFLRFRNNANNADIFTKQDFNDLKNSSCFIARKFDTNKDFDIIKEVLSLSQKDNI